MMTERLSDIRQKEVINVCDGCRLGYAEDFELDLHGCCLLSLVVPGPCRILGIAGREYDYVIPWQCVKKIGNDTILVEVDRDCIRQSKKKKKLL